LAWSPRLCFASTLSDSPSGPDGSARPRALRKSRRLRKSSSPAGQAPRAHLVAVRGTAVASSPALSRAASGEGTVLVGERSGQVRNAVVSDPSASLGCAGLPARMTRGARSTVPSSVVVALWPGSPPQHRLLDSGFGAQSQLQSHAVNFKVELVLTPWMGQAARPWLVGRKGQNPLYVLSYYPVSIER
jgi:hypothetical protein